MQPSSSITKRIDEAIANIMDAKEDPMYHPSSPIHLLAHGFPLCRSVQVPTTLACQFPGRIESVGGSNDHYHVWLSQDSAIALRESLLSLITTALYQSCICRTEADARRLIHEVINNEKYAIEPDFHPVLNTFRRERETANRFLGAVELPLHLKSVVSYPFALGSSLVRKLLHKKNSTDAKNCESVITFCFSGTRRGKCEAYQEIIRPCLIAYSKVHRVTGQRAGCFISWFPTVSFDPGFDEVSPIIPNDHFDRAYDAIQRMNAAIKSVDCDSFTLYNDVFGMYKHFLRAAATIDIDMQCGIAVTKEHDSIKEAVCDLITSDVNVKADSGCNEEKALEITGTQWNSLTVIDRMRLIAASIMKIAMHGSGLYVRQLPLYGLTTSPNCADNYGICRLYLSKNVREINTMIPAHVRHRISIIAEPGIEEKFDFQEDFVRAVHSYCSENEETYTKEEEIFHKALKHLKEEFEAALNTKADKNADEKETHGVIDLLEMILHVMVSKGKKGFAAIKILGSTLEIAFSALISKIGVIQETLHASNIFKQHQKRYEELHEIKHLVDWYTGTSELLTNPQVVAIRAEIREEAPSLEGVIIDYS